MFRSFFLAFFMFTAINCSGNTLDDAYSPSRYSATDKDFINEYENSGASFKIGKAYQIKDKWYKPKHQPSYNEVGTASWYGPNVGEFTASGEHFDPSIISAAHPTLPLPSIVKITNLNNGKELMVRVNDRGPFHSTRIIDVSKAAAAELGMLGAGTAKVKVELQQEATLNDLKTAANRRTGNKPHRLFDGT